MSPPPVTPEQLAALPPEIRAVIEAIIRHYERRIAELEAEVAGLRKTPKNSSLPPNTQHPHAKPAPAKPKSKRKRGGQPGHPRCERSLIPTEDCRDVIPLKPAESRRCGTRLEGDDPEPLRHQVWELPVIEPIVTEYQQHRLSCRGPCGAGEDVGVGNPVEPGCVKALCRRTVVETTALGDRGASAQSVDALLHCRGGALTRPLHELIRLSISLNLFRIVSNGETSPKNIGCMSS